MSNKRKSSQKGRPPKRSNMGNASISLMGRSSDIYETLDMGVIEKVSLKNFMCHTQLTMTFASNVNFIVGKNGSGKSAIITALVVGLGGKASSTSRGSSLKTLIKEGNSSASIEITLRNRGNEAYKKEVFGEKITVERRLLSDGQSYYRIKNDQGKLITSKKEDLVQILDQFNVQVDNPLTCLNQEMSKHFLHSKSETDKYKFFMKSTLLEQMSNDYAFVQEHRVTMHETLKRKEKLLPDLEKEVSAKARKFQDLSSLHELKGKIDNLKGELAWADVIQLELALKPVKRQLENEQKRTQKYVQMVDKSKKSQKEKVAIFENAQKEVRECVEKARVLDPLRTNVKREYDKIRHTHRQLESRVKTLIKQRQDAVSDKRKMQKRIDDLMESINTNMEAEKNKREKRLLKLREETETLTAQWKNNSEQINQFEGALSQCKEEIDEKRKEAHRISSQKQKISILLKSLTSDRKNRLQLFGVKMPKFVQRIEEEWRKKKFHQKPRGPIGACISLKDATKAVPVESAIRSHISAFVVDNHQDMKVLSQLRSTVFSPKESSQIIIYTSRFSNTVHNVSNGKVQHSKYQCVLNLLKIDDPVIANCLIDMASIETILVIPQLKDALDVMQNSGRPPANCTQAYTGDGDEVYSDRFYSNPREPVSRFLKADVDDEIRRRQQELKDLEKKCHEVESITQEKSKELNRIQYETRRLEQLKRKSMARVRELKGEIVGLESAEDVSPPDVKDLQDEVDNYKQQIESLDKNIRKEGEELKKSKEALSNAMNEWKKHDSEMKRIKETLDESKENLGIIENEVEKAKADRIYYEDSMKKHMNAIKELTDRHKKEEQTLEKGREAAQLVCAERINTRRPPSNIANEISQIEKRITEDERDNGQREQIIAEYFEVTEKFKSIKKGMTWVRTFINEIDSYLKQRQRSFIDLRRLISMRCRITFDTLLNQRGYAGKMYFNHTGRLLQISVQPGQEGITTNDMRALSGGERSFSTVCFILSLWEEIESPFRCLDEFDVFMDMANRRVAMEMMLEIAMNDKLKQFIFLTPHDISSLPQSNQIQVWKMPDPERGQTNGTNSNS